MLMNKRANENIVEIREHPKTEEKLNSSSMLSKIDKNIKNRDTIQFMYTNIRSILNNNKLTELSKKLQDDNIDILGITESWLKEDVGNAKINIPGYNLYRKDRLLEDKMKGGGVLLYVRDNLKTVEKEFRDSTESVWINIYLSEYSKMIVGVCYRHNT